MRDSRTRSRRSPDPTRVIEHEPLLSPHVVGQPPTWRIMIELTDFYAAIIEEHTLEQVEPAHATSFPFSIIHFQLFSTIICTSTAPPPPRTALACRLSLTKKNCKKHVNTTQPRGVFIQTRPVNLSERLICGSFFLPF